MKRIATIAACMIGTASAAEDIPGIQNHAVQTMFWSEPCSETVSLIDTNPDPTLPINDAIRIMAKQAMAWGHLLGFESANPGIRGGYETILMRLRDDCARNGDRTAMDILTGYAEDMK